MVIPNRGLGKIKWLLIITVILTILHTSRICRAGWFDRGMQMLQEFTGQADNTELTTQDIAAGLKEALRVGTQRGLSGVSAGPGDSAKMPWFIFLCPKSSNHCSPLCKNSGCHTCLTTWRPK